MSEGSAVKRIQRKIPKFNQYNLDYLQLSYEEKRSVEQHWKEIFLLY